MAPWVYSFSIALFLGQTAIPLNAHAHDVANALSPFYSNSRKHGTTSHATEKVGTTTEQGFTGLFIVDGFPVQVLDGFFSIDNGTPNDPTNDIYGVVTQSGAITLNDGTRLQLSDFSSVERHLIGGPSGFIDVPGLGAIPVVNGTLNLAMVGLPGASGKIDLAGYYEVTLADGTIIQNSLTRQAEFTTRYFASGPTGSVTLGGNPPVQVFVTNGFFRLPSGETGYLQNTLDYLLENGDTGNLDSIPEITYTFPDLPEMTIHFSDGSSTQVRNGFFLLDGIPGRVIKSGEGFLFIHTDASGNHTEKSVFDLNEVTKVDCGANVSHTMCGIDLTESNPPIPTPSTPSTPSSPSNTAPTLSAIANQSIAKNSNSGALAVTTGDSETAVGSLIVSASSSNTTLIPNGNLVWGGTGASRTLTATPAVGQTGTATITYSVSDGSLTTSKTFDVSVAGTAPAFASIANQTGTVGSAFSLALSSYITATNGDSVDSYRISAGTLPSGLSLNTSSGLVSGTPLSAEGPVSVSFQAHDADGWSNTVPVQFVINTDTTPDTFAFTDVTNQTVSTLIESNAITVSGINAAANISVTGGEYQINGGTWASSAGTVTAGQTVKVRHTTSASNSTTTDTTLTIGGVSDTFTTTTVAASDTAPDAFDIPNMTNQALSTAVTTNAITVAGINTSITASTNVGTIVKNGVDTGSASTTVTAGDTVAVKLTTSGSYSTAVNGTVTIGTGGTNTDNFSVTTLSDPGPAPDTTPNAFDFSSMTNQALSTVVTTNPVTVDGINQSVTASATVGTLVRNGTDTGSASTTVVNGDTLAVKLTTAGTYDTTINGTVTIGTGGTSTDSFSVITMTIPAPTGVGIYGSTLSWNSVSLANKYQVCWDGGTTCQEVAGGTTSYGLLAGHNGKTLTVQSSTDNGANWSVESSSVTYTLDATPPATPSIAISDANGDSDSGYTNNTSVSIGITGDTDNVGVTGWYVSESSSAPAAGAGGWTGARPTSATISSGDGAKTLYVWTKDAAGNVSNAGSGGIELGTVAPSSVSWVGTTPDTKQVGYSGLILAGDKSFTGAQVINVSSLQGGIISGVSINGSGQIVFNYTTPNTDPDTIRVAGVDKYGNSFTINKQVDIPY